VEMVHAQSCGRFEWKWFMPRVVVDLSGNGSRPELW